METLEKQVVTKRRFSNPPFNFFNVRNARRALMSAAVLATLIALFYTEENWRGKRAWEQFKQKSAKRGVSMDWNVACVPPPVPEDQNFFKAPHMQEWFVGRGENDQNRRLGQWHLDEWLFRRSLAPSVDVTILPANAQVAPGSADLVLDYHAPLLSLADAKPSASTSELKEHSVQADVDVTEKFSRLIKQKLAEYHPRKFTPVVSGILFPISAEQLGPIAPLHIIVRTGSQPSTNEIKQFLPTNTVSKSRYGFDFISLENGTYRIPLISGPTSVDVPPLDSALPWIGAADYLAWSDGFADDFNAISAALDRPYARMDGNYENPVHFPIPNFISVRLCAQMLGMRAQCYLLLNQPDKALRELTLLHHLSRLLEARPTGKPMTLIAAMINVAITGIYVDTIGDGLRLKVWREPQLAALQQQLAETELLTYVCDACGFESQTLGRMADISTSKELAEEFNAGSARVTFWEKMGDALYRDIVLSPHGWIYQTAVLHARIDRSWFAYVDPVKQSIEPEKLDEESRRINESLLKPTITGHLLATMLPNYSHAMKTTAKNQTLVNEAVLACALERYRLAHGQYPETLHELMPQYLNKLPHDLIGGGALKYRKEGGKFVLYSVGWNAKDDGGVQNPYFGPNNYSVGNAIDGLAQNDWVWPFQEPLKE